MEPSFRQAVLARIKSEAKASHTPVHLLFGTLPMVIAVVAGWWYMHLRTPAASLEELVTVPIVSGLLGLGLTLLAYLAYLSIKAPRLLWEECQARLQKAENEVKGLRCVSQVDLPKGVDLKQTDDGLETSFVLITTEDLRGKAIRLSCDGPIYKKSFSAQYTVRRSKYRLLDGSHSRHENGSLVTYDARTDKDIMELTDIEAARQVENNNTHRIEIVPGPAKDGVELIPANPENIWPDDTNSVIFDFSGNRFSARPFTAIIGKVSSGKPLRIMRVKWMKAKPS